VLLVDDAPDLDADLARRGLAVLNAARRLTDDRLVAVASTRSSCAPVELSP
jgi:hypothetical protein